MGLGEKFEFLEDGIDFPFYNDIPKLSAIDWTIVLFAVLLVVACIDFLYLPDGTFPIAFCLIMLIPALYICKGDYGLFFKKVRLRDIRTILLCLIGYYAYTLIVVVLLTLFNYESSSNAILSSFANPSLLFIISICLQLLGEEFFKIFILLLVMHVVYKLTGNRGLCIALGIAATLFAFGMIHVNSYDGKILQILLIQGLGTIFDLYAYMKTKNVLVSYILHLLVDFIPFTLVFIGAMMAMPLPLI